MGENIYIKVCELLSSGQKIVLAKTIRRSGSTPRDVGSMCIITQEGTLIGTIGGGTLEYRVQKQAMALLKQEKSFIYRFRLTNEDLAGAGHVSLFVARLAKMVGFSITLIDDRPEFANYQRFPEADNILITDFKQAFEQLEISQNSYILIITRGHLHDKTVLQHALGTNASYIGMIGSTKKRNIIYKALMDEGFSKNDLEKVYSPIGIDINAETPEEIAVSIVGELIKKRAPEKETKNLIL